MSLQAITGCLGECFSFCYMRFAVGVLRSVVHRSSPRPLRGNMLQFYRFRLIFFFAFCFSTREGASQALGSFGRRCISSARLVCLPVFFSSTAEEEWEKKVVAVLILILIQMCVSPLFFFFSFSLPLSLHLCFGLIFGFLHRAHFGISASITNL